MLYVVHFNDLVIKELFAHFFNDKATEHLFGEGILPEDFNDDRIGRVLELIRKLNIKKLIGESLYELKSRKS